MISTLSSPAFAVVFPVVALFAVVLLAVVAEVVVSLVAETSFSSTILQQELNTHPFLLSDRAICLHSLPSEPLREESSL